VAVEHKEIRVYVRHRSWRCWLTRRLLNERGYRFEVIDATGDLELRLWLTRFTGRQTLPYVFIDQRPVGGLEEMRVFVRSATFDRLVRGEV
jgi:glutaredoxin